LTEYGLTSH